MNVASITFNLFEQHLCPFIFWLNKTIKLIKQFSRALGLKNNQLNLYELIEEYNPNPYDQVTNSYDVL